MDTNQRLDNLEKKLQDLENRSIKVNLGQTEQENIKNVIFEGYYQMHNVESTAQASARYIKTTWKNKVIYLPYYV